MKTKEKDCGFFKIPKVRVLECSKTKELSERRRREWLARINRRGVDLNLDKYKVCSRNFLSGRPASLFDDCNPDWLPSQHLGYPSKTVKKQRYNRRKARSQQLDRNGAVSPVASVSSPDEPLDGEQAEGVQINVDAACQTDLLGTDIDNLRSQILQTQHQLTEKEKALEQLTFTEESLEVGSNRVAFYSGLPSFFMLTSVFHLLKDHVPHSARHALTQFEEMMVFLIRIRKMAASCKIWHTDLVSM